jgi:hypothetical protein
MGRRDRSNKNRDVFLLGEIRFARRNPPSSWDADRLPPRQPSYAPKANHPESFSFIIVARWPARVFLRLKKPTRQVLAVSFTETRRCSRSAPGRTCPTARNFDMRVKRLTETHFYSSMWHSADHPKPTNWPPIPQASHRLAWLRYRRLDNQSSGLIVKNNRPNNF